MIATDDLSDDIPQLKALIACQRADMVAQQAEIAHLKLWIAKLRRHVRRRAPCWIIRRVPSAVRSKGVGARSGG